MLAAKIVSSFDVAAIKALVVLCNSHDSDCVERFVWVWRSDSEWVISKAERKGGRLLELPSQQRLFTTSKAVAMTVMRSS